EVDTMLPFILAICTVLSVVHGQDVAVVGFSAGIPETKTIAKDEIVKFPQVFANHGNGYDNSTGIFTATKPGLYYFTLSAVSQKQKAFGFKLYYNEAHTFKIYGVGSDPSVMGANSILLRLKSRDRVYVKTFFESHIFGDSEGTYAIFNGFLVTL
ncbi:unnamed protein product, partial [Candidula unifasciata]